MRTSMSTTWGCSAATQIDRLHPVGRFAEHVDVVGEREHLHEPVPEQRVVVDDQDSNDVVVRRGLLGQPVTSIRPRAPSRRR